MASTLHMPLNLLNSTLHPKLRELNQISSFIDLPVKLKKIQNPILFYLFIYYLIYSIVTSVIHKSKQYPNSKNNMEIVVNELMIK